MSRTSSRSRTLTRGGTLVAALAALALVTAGCGGGSGSSGGSSKTRGVTITVALASDAPPKAVLGEFTKETGIKVKWVNIDWDSLQTKISAARPDLLRYDFKFNWTRRPAGQAGLVLPMDPTSTRRPWLPTPQLARSPATATSWASLTTRHSWSPPSTRRC